MKFITTILVLVAIAGTVLVGGIMDYPKPQGFRSAPPSTPVQIRIPSPGAAQKGLQLQALGGNQVACSTGSKIAAHLLLDNSTSMTAIQGGKKMKNMKASVIQFTRTLLDDDVLGIQIFNPTRVIVPINFYAASKATVDSVVNRISGYKGTPTAEKLRDAKIEMDKEFPKYPEHSKNLIMFTDGCPDKGQKPIPVAQEIKNSGIRIIVIGIELGNAGKCDRLGGAEGARQLMEQIASSPTDYRDAPDSNDLSGVLEDLRNRLTCQPQ